MINEGSPEDSFKKIAARVKEFGDPAQNPGDFVRVVCRQWKADGGKTAGKPRHSDRYLDEQLKTQGTPVRSLTPKLIGKTNIGPDDGAALIRYFLSNWPEPGEKEGDVAYSRFLSDKEIDAVSNFIEAQIRATDRPAKNEIADTGPEERLFAQDIARLIPQYFEDCDALITVSPEHTFVAVQNRTELIGFRNLVNALWTIERRDKKKRPLIWVFDLGDQRFDDPESRRKFLNVQALITRFKALKRFEDRQSAERWKWLQSRVTIILLDTLNDAQEDTPQPAARNRLRRPIYIAHNISLSATATDWLASKEFRALYGTNLENIEQRSFSVFYNATRSWSSASEWADEDNKEPDLRYFGYASFESGLDKSTVARGLELPPLPRRYAEGFRSVCAAAAHTLGLKYPDATDTLADGDNAIRDLNYLGYTTLRLDEFLTKY